MGDYSLYQIIVLIVVISFSIFIHIKCLLKVIKLYSKRNVKVSGKINQFKYHYGSDISDINEYCTLVYSYDGRDFESGYIHFLSSKHKGDKVDLIINKYHGTVIALASERKIMVFWLIITSFLPLLSLIGLLTFLFEFFSLKF